MKNDETILYRFFKEGRLLYVGITARIHERFRTHRQNSSWYELADQVKMERLRTRTAALEAERLAIIAERPEFNIIHSTGLPQVEEVRSDVWLFRDRADPKRELITSPLFLYPELDCSSCVGDCDATDGESQFEFYVQYLARHYPAYLEKDAVPIHWSVVGDGIGEDAPYQGRDEDFLTYFTWPEDKDGVPLDWFRLPLTFRFPEFSKALGWQPSPLQKTAPLDSIFKSRNRNR